MNLLNSIILKFNQILNIFLLIYNVYHLNKYINHDELSYYVKNIKKNKFNRSFWYQISTMGFR